MANRRFCDRCDSLIVPADDEPFIRQDVAKRVQVALIITGLNGLTIVPDLCNRCKQEIVIDGTPLPAPKPAEPPPGQPIPFLAEVPKIQQMSPIAGVGSSSTAKPIFESSFSEEKEPESQPQETKKRKAATK